MSFEPVAPNKMGEQPLFIQKWKLRRAKKRSRLLRAIRCALGWHNPPWNQPTDDIGAITVGGTCTRCDDQEWREVTWIGNAWDFLGAVRQSYANGGTHGGVDHFMLEDAVHARMEELLS